MENKPKIVSKGSANRHEIDNNGTNKRLFTKRMNALNKQLLQSISDVLSTEQIGHLFQNLEIRITQVCTSGYCLESKI